MNPRAMSDTKRRLLTSPLLVLMLALGAAPAAQPQGPPAAQPAPPRLLVMIVIDQFRADYPDRYGSTWTSGLHRLFTEGATFPRNAYPYAGTVTCAGHATIGTGLFPASHGMTANTWYDQATRTSVACADDRAAAPIGFGGLAAAEHHGPRALLAQTFADQLRTHSPGTRVTSISLKARSAIGMAGHAGPGVMVMWEEDSGVWATSGDYAKTPWPEVDRYVAAHPVARDYGAVWSRLLPDAAYRSTDDGAGESASHGWLRTFPHPLDSPSGKPDQTFVWRWERSPWSDAYIGGLADGLVDALQLGRGNGTDMLALSFSALDLVGHEFGPASHEVQDVLVRLDRTIGQVLDTLDREVGRDHYVLALSADHGVALVPEQEQAAGRDAGRVAPAAIQRAVNTAAGHVLGVDRAYAALNDQNLSLLPGVFDRLRQHPGGIEAVRAALTAIPGLKSAYDRDQLIDESPTTDADLQAWRLSNVPGRSGDFVLTLKPGWIVRGTATGTTHGSPNAYDQQVPLVFFGAGVVPGQYDVASSPADIAPTFAALTGVTLSAADGHARMDVFKRR